MFHRLERGFMPHSHEMKKPEGSFSSARRTASSPVSAKVPSPLVTLIAMNFPFEVFSSSAQYFHRKSPHRAPRCLGKKELREQVLQAFCLSFNRHHTAGRNCAAARTLAGCPIFPEAKGGEFSCSVVYVMLKYIT